jgi:hypothetical protein
MAPYFGDEMSLRKWQYLSKWIDISHYNATRDALFWEELEEERSHVTHYDYRTYQFNKFNKFRWHTQKWGG